MRDEFYETEPFNTMHSTFGGLVKATDFIIGEENSFSTLSDIAERIARDWEFDQKCLLAAKSRDERQERQKGHQRKW